MLKVPELLDRIPNDELVNATAEQSQHLDQIRRQPTTQSLHLVRVNQNALKENKLRVSLPSDGSVNFLKTGGEVQSAKEVTWLGTMENVPGGNATFVFKEGNLTGSITSVKGLYRVTPIGGGVHALVKIDIRKLPPEEPPASERKKQ
jgi:hypothetical protein